MKRTLPSITATLAITAVPFACLAQNVKDCWSKPPTWVVSPLSNTAWLGGVKYSRTGYWTGQFGFPVGAPFQCGTPSTLTAGATLTFGGKVAGTVLGAGVEVSASVSFTITQAFGPKTPTNTERCQWYLKFGNLNTPVFTPVTVSTCLSGNFNFPGCLISVSSVVIATNLPFPPTVDPCCEATTCLTAGPGAVHSAPGFDCLPDGPGITIFLPQFNVPDSGSVPAWHPLSQPFSTFDDLNTYHKHQIATMPQVIKASEGIDAVTVSILEADEATSQIFTVTDGRANIPYCYADADSNASLNIFDFILFAKLYDAGDPFADCDGNEQFTIFDYLCFQSAFAAGCP